MPGSQPVNRQSADETFGARLKRVREAAGLTQLELAREIGLAVSAVSGWETTTRQPDKPETYVRMARALNCSIDYLLTGRRIVGAAALVAGLETLLEQARALDPEATDAATVEYAKPKPEETLPGDKPTRREKGA